MTRVLYLTSTPSGLLFRQFWRLGLYGFLPGHLELDFAKIHGLESQGYCSEFLVCILCQNQKLKGWLAIVQKSVLMQCFENPFLKHVLQIYNQS